jgi:hypothetical protein
MSIGPSPPRFATVQGDRAIVAHVENRDVIAPAIDGGESASDQIEDDWLRRVFETPYPPVATTCLWIERSDRGDVKSHHRILSREARRDGHI